MILLEGPYASDFLKQTISDYRIPMLENPFSQEVVGQAEHVVLSADEVVRRMKQNPEQLIYTNSENSIHWIEKNLSFTPFPEKISLFKNKIRFRELLQSRYPDYFFQGIPFRDLEKTDPSGFSFPFIIKPAVGFFSMGVYRVGKPEEWADVVSRIKDQVDQVQQLYPKEVFDATEFIAEAVIEGTEYAIDCYYDVNGKPVILNIMKHLFSSDMDMSDRVYITSKEVVASNLEPMGQFLEEMGNAADVRNFAAHVEVRMDSSGNIIPIEVNPMRFGGWCTTPDLAWYAFGMNIYDFFLSRKKPDWNRILAAKNDDIYSVVVLDNSTGTAGRNIDSFDYDGVWKSFAQPLEMRRVDYKRYPLFGFLFAQTQPDQTDELIRILKSDLSEYIQQAQGNGEG